MMPATVPNASVSTTRPLKVLFVDDQTILLNAIERVVRRQARDWEVELAASGKEALARLETKPFDVIVSDMRMPGMDGVDLLEYVRDHYPNLIRIILSGFSQNDRTIESVRVAHQFFIKPFSTQDLIDALQLTHCLYKRIRNPGLQSLIASIDRLPTPKQVYFDIQTAINNPNTTVEEIAQIIVRDTGITGKILQVVNSAFFGQSQRIESIEQAIKVLGIESIRSLVLIAGIASDQKEILNGIISLDLYSQHCIEVAMIAKKLACLLGKTREEQATLFTIGLLHDVGKLVLLKKYVEVYHEQKWRESPYSAITHISQIEKVAVDHAIIGAALVALWGIPAKIVNAIAFHEYPQEVENDDQHFALILHIADKVSQYLHCGEKLPLLSSGHVNPAVVKPLLDEQTLHQFVESLRA